MTNTNQKTDDELVADFLATKKVTVYAPAHAAGNEAGQGTSDHVKEVRKNFRKAATLARRAEKEEHQKRLIAATMSALKEKK